MHVRRRDITRLLFRTSSFVWQPPFELVWIFIYVSLTRFYYLCYVVQSVGTICCDIILP